MLKKLSSIPHCFIVRVFPYPCHLPRKSDVWKLYAQRKIEVTVREMRMRIANFCWRYFWSVTVRNVLLVPVQTQMYQFTHILLFLSILWPSLWLFRRLTSKPRAFIIQLTFKAAFTVVIQRKWIVTSKQETCTHQGFVFSHKVTQADAIRSSSFITLITKTKITNSFRIYEKKYYSLQIQHDN